MGGAETRPNCFVERLRNPKKRHRESKIIPGIKYYLCRMNDRKMFKMLGEAFIYIYGFAFTITRMSESCLERLIDNLQ